MTGVMDDKNDTVVMAGVGTALLFRHQPFSSTICMGQEAVKYRTLTRRSPTLA